MSVLKSWDTNLRQSEKKTLRAFLGLYAFFSILLLCLLGWGYFSGQKEAMLQVKRFELNVLAKEQIKRLKTLHVNIDKTRLYPRDERFRSAIYDSDGVQIFSLLGETPDLSKIIYKTKGVIHYIKEPESYYLGTRYLVLEVPDDEVWMDSLYQKMLWFGGAMFVLLLAAGYFLLRLFLRPMREAIALLDRFIKDTTHELNTPISAILSNIEMINTADLDVKLAKKIKRIDIGARTVSNLYQDLTYLTLGRHVASDDEIVDMKALIEERLEYFSLACESKRLNVSAVLDAVKMRIDRKKITKLLDNLLSNAIKYNRVGGFLHVTLKAGCIEVQDGGRGIAQEKVQAMFERYARFDKSEGGFGIGLSIVAMIAQEYDLSIAIDSKVGEGTIVRVQWDD